MRQPPENSIGLPLNTAKVSHSYDTPVYDGPVGWYVVAFRTASKTFLKAVMNTSVSVAL